MSVEQHPGGLCLQAQVEGQQGGGSCSAPGAGEGRVEGLQGLPGGDEGEAPDPEQDLAACHGGPGERPVDQEPGGQGVRKLENRTLI